MNVIETEKKILETSAETVAVDNAAAVEDAAAGVVVLEGVADAVVLGSNYHS